MYLLPPHLDFCLSKRFSLPLSITAPACSDLRPCPWILGRSQSLHVVVCRFLTFGSSCWHVLGWKPSAWWSFPVVRIHVQGGMGRIVIVEPYAVSRRKGLRKHGMDISSFARSL